jgi:hypothetical protein
VKRQWPFSIEDTEAIYRVRSSYKGRSNTGKSQLGVFSFKQQYVAVINDYKEIQILEMVEMVDWGPGK